MKTQVLEKEQTQGDASALVTLDMAKVCSLVRAQEAQRALPRSSPDLQLQPLGSPIADIALSRASGVPLSLWLRRQEAMLPACMLKLQPMGHQPLAVTLRQLNPDTYRVLMAPPHGGVQPLEFNIPACLPRFTNAATLKAMVGADSSDVLLRKVGERWEICPGAYPVDLEDHTQVFRVRQLEILS